MRDVRVVDLRIVVTGSSPQQSFKRVTQVVKNLDHWVGGEGIEYESFSIRRRKVNSDPGDEQPSARGGAA